jgi:hypothetical protein
MNKHLELLKEKYNPKQYDKDAVFGVINGFEVVISLSNISINDCFVKIYSNFHDTQVNVARFIDSHKKDYKFRLCEFSKYALTFDHMAFAQKGWVEKAEKIILEITDYLKTLNAKDYTYCPACGEKIDIPTEVKANGLPITLCSKCAASIQTAQAKKEEEYQAAPGNYAKGLLGSIGGALIGGFVWVALAVMLGFMSAFIAMLISYLAAMGYDKMKGKQNKVKVIINFIVSLVVIVLSTYLSYVFIVGDANTLHHILATDGEVLGGFIGDMLFSIIFGALGIFAYTQSLKKKLHK